MDQKLPAAIAAADHQENTMSTSYENVSSSFDTDDDEHAMVKLLQIIVKRTGSGSEAPYLELSIEHGATVMDLKTLIQDELADESPYLMVPVERQRLIFSGRMLTDNEQKLVEHVKLKTDRVNYVHLAPLPKNVTPSVRNAAVENKLHARRMANRAHRASRPYEPISPRRMRLPGVPATTTRRSHERPPSPFLEANERLRPATSCFRLGGDHLVVTGEHSNSLLQALGLVHGHSRGLNNVEESITHDSNELSPLCNMISSNVSSLVGNRNYGEQEARQEQTILLCEQLSQRSMSLARTLRQNLREERHRQLLSAHEILQAGLGAAPWEN